MSEVQTLFDKLEKMPLEKLMNLCALSIEQKLEEKRLDMLLLMLETKLTKYRTMIALGMNPNE